MFAVNIKNIKPLKCHTFSKKKTSVRSIICSKCASKDEEILKKRDSIEILKILSLVFNIEENRNKYGW